ncbi:DNA repair protein RAD51 homolog 3 [Melanotaenia boesemani]|uniref:DNA repair protein RAD51 homolog 3 n=1 Tax=Melanotaenia boesemani TaxID=1250792 RepID=UPI001C04F50C|nr:DNA repair protein RAD51 homolog 3 [Melanotaenia boesemani]
MLRPLSSLFLSPDVKLKLVRAGFQFTADLLHLSPPELSEDSGVSQQEALEVLQAVKSVGGGPSLTALELLQKEEEFRSIVTFSAQLDHALQGGFPAGKTTEVCGVPGVGKTQLCMQLAVDVQVPQCFGGVEGQVVFVDTEGSFLLQRVVDIATATVRHCSLLAEDAEQRVALTTFSVESILANIFLVRCHDYVELLAELHLLPDFLQDRPRVRLLVIDSVAFPFRRFDDLSQRTRLLHGIGQQLNTIAMRHHIAVATTNQMTTRLRGSKPHLVPALGEGWGHTPTIRLLLQWKGSQRLAAIFKSPGHLDASVQYQITTDGFRDADQSKQMQNKRTQTHTDQSASSLKKPAADWSETFNQSEALCV